jgi:hypothetical protein
VLLWPAISMTPAANELVKIHPRGPMMAAWATHKRRANSTWVDSTWVDSAGWPRLSPGPAAELPRLVLVRAGRSRQAVEHDQDD